jgi:hypothetical protein
VAQRHEDCWCRSGISLPSARPVFWATRPSPSPAFPPLWSWQITWWILGIIMMWALCFKAEMSTTNEIQIERAEKETNIVIKEA